MDSLSIGDALFSGTRQRVLGLLFSKPDKRFYTNEILRWAGMGRGTVMRELERLTQAGILQMSREGNLCYYQANQASPMSGSPVWKGLLPETSTSPRGSITSIARVSVRSLPRPSETVAMRRGVPTSPGTSICTRRSSEASN